MAGQPPAWLAYSGEKRVQAELYAMLKSLRRGTLALPATLNDLTTHGDQVSVWRWKLRNFDNDLVGGEALNRDLQALQQRHGMDHILMEARFPSDYPARPFLLRVVSPRCQWYTGHVTAGGSICTEALTLSGSPSGWQPSLTMEAVLMETISSMVDCEVVNVRTATGPGGRSGPLRLDLAGTYCGGNPMREYSLSEAEQAYQRMASSHGWNTQAPRPGRQPGPAPPIQAQRPAAAAGGSGGWGSGAPAAAAQPFGYWHSNAVGTSAAGAAAFKASPRKGKEQQQQQQASPRQQPKRPRPLPAVVDLTGDEEGLAGNDGPGRSAAGPSAVRRRAGAGGAVGSRQEEELLKRLQEENEALRREKEELEKRHAQERELGLAEPPSHWDISARTRTGALEYVDLPLPGVPAGSAVATAAFSEEKIAELMTNGLSRADAVQALHDSGGSVSKALMALISRLEGARPSGDAGPSNLLREEDDASFDPALKELLVHNGLKEGEAEAALSLAKGDFDKALEMLAEEGPEALFRRYRNRRRASHAATAQQAAADAAAAAAQQAQQARQRELEQEVQRVLDHFADANRMGGLVPGGVIRREQVVSVRRIQNLALWSDYQHRRRKVEREAGGGANEQQLWHGSAQNILEVIAHEGFDCRNSNPSGLLGQGAYFAASSSYSSAYSRAPVRALGATNPLPASVPRLAVPPGCHAMFLCRVALGRSTPGSAGLRKAPAGFQSTSGAPAIWAVYHNDQAYPEYVVTYRTH